MKKNRKLPYLPVLLAPLMLFIPLLVKGEALFWGVPSLQFVPWWDFAWETILDGHMPFWNPYLGMGAPLIANYQSALFYPPNWLYFLLHGLGGVPLMAWGQALLVVFHLLWAGLGMIRLANKLSLNPVAQAVSGLAFSLSGYLVARAGFLSLNAAVAWLPWALLFSLDLASQGKNPRAWLRLGIVFGVQFLAGHAQTAWYTVLLTAIWVTFWACLHTRHQPFWSRLQSIGVSWGRYALSGLMGGALAAVQLLPTAEYLLQSQRASAVEYEFALNYSFWPWRFLTLLVPDMFGNPAHGDYWGYGNFWEDALYIGLLPLFLGLLAVFLVRKQSAREEKGRWSQHHRALIWFCLGITLLSFVLALGKNTPVFPWLYEHIPTFAMFQAPTRFSIWAEICLALLAGIGVHYWRRPQKRALYWTRLATAGAFSITLGAGLAWLYVDEIEATFLPATALAGLWALGTGGLALTAPPHQKQRRRILWRWGVAFWVAADLLFAGWGLNPGIPIDFYQPNERNDVPGRVYLPEEDESELKYGEFFTFDTFHQAEDWYRLRRVQLPNLNMLDDIPMINNFDPFVPGHYTEWMARLETAEPALWSDMLDLMDVRTTERLSSAGEDGVLFSPREGGKTVRWYDCAVFADQPAAALELLTSREIDLKETLVLTGKPVSGDAPCDPEAGEAVMISRPSPNRIVIHTEADQAGWVFWSEIWYPGWTVRVDGRKAALLRANYAFQGVPVPAGNHEVIFMYRPTAFWIGLGITLGAVLIGWVLARKGGLLAQQGHIFPAHLFQADEKNVVQDHRCGIQRDRD